MLSQNIRNIHRACSMTCMRSPHIQYKTVSIYLAQSFRRPVSMLAHVFESTKFEPSPKPKLSWGRPRQARK